MVDFRFWNIDMGLTDLKLRFRVFDDVRFRDLFAIKIGFSFSFFFLLF